ncbi:sensor histidine kinase [Actinomadura kijaniata]|uniref:sensor histidine kinase n=1 Tax=Actinomadura kijaniata TaxID=46161 RepID=UPI003F1AFEA1
MTISSAPGRLRARAASLPWAADAAFAALTVFDVATLAAHRPAPSVPGLALWGAQTVPLLWRRRWTLGTLAAMTAAFVAFTVLDPVPGKTPGPYFLVLGVYAAARHAPPAASLPGAVLTLVTAATADLVWGRSPAPRPDSLQPITATTYLVFLSVAYALGYAVRRIGLDARRLREANERLRVERERNARQAVLTERARIARDLHDVVAHHVSAIAVQARSTEDVLPDDPALGRRGAARIAETADTALIEMRRILGLLDGLGEPAGSQPSLGDLDRLVEAAEATGCRVRADLAAEAAALPPPVQVTAYRIVQEALTNVRKHAGAADVRITLGLTGTGLVVEVGNGPPEGPRAVPGSGYGLIGLRERVAAFGGSLRAGPDPAGGWLVHAELPLEGPR